MVYELDRRQIPAVGALGLIADVAAEIRPITRKIGDRQVTAYEAGNCSECIELNVGGVFSEGILINGLVEVWIDSDASRKLMRLFATTIRKEFRLKIKAFWIGREAHELLKQGWRLTQNVDAAPFVDLKITDSTSELTRSD
ncbi:hypothetical protein NDK50_12360 [Paraburkholderia bryophila]|uniref:hypothetical protein n=1 Tax=Paraburkholderia bryophila TaxID=420952 RepID=UPI00234BAD2A|nr:hypothetical protein [Paraburkholderia bryophila]WCM18263.1 hypothetical protein NDK50_12360 [Paraburkholderia bryophila]